MRELWGDMESMHPLPKLIIPLPVLKLIQLVKINRGECAHCGQGGQIFYIAFNTGRIICGRCEEALTSCVLGLMQYDAVMN